MCTITVIFHMWGTKDVVKGTHVTALTWRRKEHSRGIFWEGELVTYINHNLISVMSTHLYTFICAYGLSGYVRNAGSCLGIWGNF